ncbi:CopL family metal-binding regulatory protein [Lysobacter spongiicola]|uniref:CopL family metal-binding regulatory protein n=1 Tax=Novilysobacter spongiicola TaxID=435289 RepID=UPI00117F2686
MSLQHLLLRVLVCIALVLNGSGLAVAATQMHVQHLAMVSSMPAPAPAEDDHAVCGEHAEAAPAVEAALSGNHSTAIDCCEGADCAVVCPAGILGTLTAPAQGWGMTSHILAAGPALADRPAPSLQSRYRPPVR